MHSSNKTITVLHCEAAFYSPHHHNAACNLSIPGNSKKKKTKTNTLNTFVQTQSKNPLRVTELLLKHNSTLWDCINSIASQLCSLWKCALRWRANLMELRNIAVPILTATNKVQHPPHPKLSKAHSSATDWPVYWEHGCRPETMFRFSLQHLRAAGSILLLTHKTHCVLVPSAGQVSGWFLGALRHWGVSLMHTLHMH